MKKHIKPIIIFLAIVFIQIVLHVPFLEEPLERDEGIYGYMAQTLLAGGNLYKDAVDNKPPIVYFLYALNFKMMGESIRSIRLFTLFYSILTTFLIFMIGRLLLNTDSGLLAALLYAVFGGGPFIQGTSANCETFLILFALLAFYFFIRGQRSGSLPYFILAGICSGLAFLTKQVALFCFLPLLIFCGTDLKKLLRLFFGFALVLTGIALYFIYKGCFADLLNFAFFFNIKYLVSLPFYASKLTNVIYIMNFENSILWVLALSGSFYILKKERSRDLLFMVVWGFFSVIAVSYTGRYFGHYFIIITPALVILSAYSLNKWGKEFSFNLQGLLAGFSLGMLTLFVLIYQYPFYLQYSPARISYEKYDEDIFNRVLAAARDIKTETSPEDYVYNWGLEGGINFYTQRKSTSKYFYIMPNFKPEYINSIQNEVLSGIKEKKPKFIVFSTSKWSFWELRYYILENYKLFKRYDKGLYVYKRK